MNKHTKFCLIIVHQTVAHRRDLVRAHQVHRLRQVRAHHHRLAVIIAVIDAQLQIVAAAAHPMVK